MKHRVIAVIALLQGLAIGFPANAQLTLTDALRRADRSAFANRIAAGTAAAKKAQALAPLEGVLPRLRLEGGYVRTTDPIGAFGSALRQRTISQADFDPVRLNNPDAIGNYQGGIVLEQPLLNADAWIGRRAAIHAADASTASEQWTRLSIRVEVVRAYYGTVLATERATMLRSAAHAAHAHQTQAELMVRQGMVTKSDALLAAVRAGEMDAQLAEADGAATTARLQLAVLLGGNGSDMPPDIGAPIELPSAPRIRAVISSDTAPTIPQLRADIVAATLALDAARADALRARAAYLPRISSFARYDWNSPNGFYRGARNWTTGIVVSWNPFGGASEIADMRTTSALEGETRAMTEAARANARLDVEQTRTALTVALVRLTIAERMIAQSVEAHRIITRKYEGGLATVVELLDAQAAETQSALAFANARYAAIVSAAERRRAMGIDPASLAALDVPLAVAPGTVPLVAGRGLQ